MLLTVYRITPKAPLLLLAFVVTLASCRKSDNSSVKTFATPEDAGKALLASARSGDQNAVLVIFGPGSRDLISSGDPVQDKNIVNSFLARYQVMHRWRRMDDGSQILLVGADNFPFPIPLKKNDQGKWFFDTAAGRQEVLNRRIGRDELAVIQVCRTVADAESDYFSQRHDGAPVRQYAMKFISDPGRQNGLYWQSAKGQPLSPLGPLVAFATSEGYAVKPNAYIPFHGYYFHMLTGQSDKAPGGAKNYLVGGRMVHGFALVAYPANYRNSGIMTFIIDQDHVLLQKDLGEKTASVASNMVQFDPDASWALVKE